MALECIYSRDGISETDYIECFTSFLADTYLREVREIVFAPDETDHYGVKVCAKLLLEHDQKIGTLILFNEQEILPIFSDALIALQRRLLAEARAELAARTRRRRHGDGDEDEGEKDDEDEDASVVLTQAEGVMENASVKCNVHIRLHNLPPGFVKRNVSMISSADSGQFIEVAGTVIRTGMIKMLEAEKEFQCTSGKCGHRFRVVADLSQDGALEMPKRCPSGGKCKSTTFDVVDGSRICCDYQELRIQEQMQTLSVGMIPRQILVILLNDVVDVCKAGDDISISGRLIQRWMPLKEGARCEIELALLANNVSVRNDSSGIRYITDDLIDEFEQFWADARAARRCYTARNFILSSVCPQIYGLFVVKLAVTLALIGGCETTKEQGDTNEDGHRRESAAGTVSENTAAAMAAGGGDMDAEEKGARVHRASSHLLLVGDPGTGKSQFLRYAAKLSTRSVLTTGIGTSSAGLTCTAVKDCGEWMLEGGALVLADRGLCCIDEFSAIRQHDRGTIHEAMEQQTVSVAKAGLVCKLNTRCTIIAATNPKGKYDPYADIVVNTNIESPLLSRFDVVLVLLDNAELKWDNIISDFILAANEVERADAEEEARRGGSGRHDHLATQRVARSPSAFATQSSVVGTRGRGRGPNSRAGSPTSPPPALSPGHPLYRQSPTLRHHDQVWNMRKLKAYLVYVKGRFNPLLSPEAQEVLLAYYQMQRSSTSSSASRTTIRMLQSLVRLAQAHARLMFRGEVIVDDAVVAIEITEASTTTDSILELESTLHSHFPTHPEDAIQRQMLSVLQKVDFELPPDVGLGMTAAQLAAIRDGGGGGGDSGGGGSGSQSLGEPGAPTQTPAHAARLGNVSSGGASWPSSSWSRFTDVDEDAANNDHHRGDAEHEDSRRAGARAPLVPGQAAAPAAAVATSSGRTLTNAAAAVAPTAKAARREAVDRGREHDRTARAELSDEGDDWGTGLDIDNTNARGGGSDANSGAGQPQQQLTGGGSLLSAAQSSLTVLNPLLNPMRAAPPARTVAVAAGAAGGGGGSSSVAAASQRAVAVDLFRGAAQAISVLGRSSSGASSARQTTMQDQPAAAAPVRPAPEAAPQRAVATPLWAHIVNDEDDDDDDDDGGGDLSLSDDDEFS